MKNLKEQTAPDPNAAAAPATPAPAAAPTPAPAAPPAMATPATPAAPTAAPTDPAAAAPAPGGDMAAPAGDASQDAAAGEEGADSEGGDEGGGEDEMPEGQPPVDKEDPISAVFDYGKEIAKQTIEPEIILKAIKTSIQSNFGGNFEAAWPVVQRLKDTENSILIDVANRLSLFISGTIQENKDKGMKPMKVSKTEIRQLVREAVKAQTTKPKRKEIQLTNEQFEKIVKNVVVKKLQEGALFDTYRSEIDREQSQIEQQLTSADIRRMAIDLFEKICDKTGVDADSLTPEAMQFVKAELDRMVTAAQEIANKLIQVAAVVKTASGGAQKTKEEG